MIDVIVYNSETGSCKRYAELLSEALNVPAKPFGEAVVLPDKKAMYISWLTAGKISGLGKAMKTLPVAAVVQVGISPVRADTAASTRKANKIPDSVAVFCKQGGLHMSKLSGPFRAIMTVVNKKVLGDLKKKTELDAQEKALYQMVTTGEGEPASWDIDDIVAWCKK
ncbi:MAG: hypothetical protein IJV41_08515 [Oscillospiraceae bacterium]|nr:hypothetical protein [Oscillospiraceae bacterium]